jgi:Nucleotidyl transferase AbiEii toxin, Type IV TA system
VFPLAEFRDCLERTASLLRACQVRFYLTGGAAAIAYGDPRTTQDVDLVVEVDALRDCLPQFLDLVKQDRFLFNENTIRQAIVSQRQFQLIDVASTMKLDIYPKELVPGGFERAIMIELMPGLSLPVASRPDLVISKLIWISKGSHKSRRDVRQIMLRASGPELEMVSDFADRMSLRSLLDEVLAEPDEIDA